MVFEFPMTGVLPVSPVAPDDPAHASSGGSGPTPYWWLDVESGGLGRLLPEGTPMAQLAH
jgi:hypothetical protein